MKMFTTFVLLSILGNGAIAQSVADTKTASSFLCMTTYASTMVENENACLNFCADNLKISLEDCNWVMAKYHYCWDDSQKAFIYPEPTPEVARKCGIPGRMPNIGPRVF